MGRWHFEYWYYQSTLEPVAFTSEYAAKGETDKVSYADTIGD